MKSENLSSLDSFPYFTIEAVKQLLGDESVAAGTIQTALYRWMKAGQIIRATLFHHFRQQVGGG